MRDGILTSLIEWVPAARHCDMSVLIYSPRRLVKRVHRPVELALLKCLRSEPGRRTKIDRGIAPEPLGPTGFACGRQSRPRVAVNKL
jgi:hypothetical protein